MIGSEICIWEREITARKRGNVNAMKKKRFGGLYRGSCGGHVADFQSKVKERARIFMLHSLALSWITVSN